MMGSAPPDSMYEKPKLEFKNNTELEEYYEDHYKKGGYKGGWVIHGVNTSNIFHRARFESALAFLDLKRSDILLDVGCGNGVFSLRFAKKVKKVYAIDIAGNSFTRAKKKAPKNLLFQKQNMEDLKFEKGFFDKVVCIEALEHSLHPSKAIKEFRRVLKKGETMVLTYPMLNQSRITRLQMKMGLKKFFSVSEHLNEWSYDELISNFESNGFELLSSEGIGLDLGPFEYLQFNAHMTRKIAHFQVNTRKFPRNSYFVSFSFKKK